MEFSLCRKLKVSNLYIFAILWSKPLRFQTLIIRSNRIHSLKYLRFMPLGLFVARNQLLIQIISDCFSQF